MLQSSSKLLILPFGVVKILMQLLNKGQLLIMSFLVSVGLFPKSHVVLDVLLGTLKVLFCFS